MQGLQKPLLYLLNPERKEELPFDIDDQIYIRHTDDESLEDELNKKMPLLIEKVLLLSGFQSEQRNLIQIKLNKLSPDAKELLKRLVLEGHLVFRIDEKDELIEWIQKSLDLEARYIKELLTQRFIVDETMSGGTRTIKIRKLNDHYRKYLEELLF